MPMTTCPTCAAPLQATVVRYLSNVQLDDGHVVAHQTWDGNDPDGYAWDHPTTRVYCENDHEQETWGPPLTSRGVAS